MTDALPAAADGIAGTAGALGGLRLGVTVADGADGSDDPTAFVAVTVNE